MLVYHKKVDHLEVIDCTYTEFAGHFDDLRSISSFIFMLAGVQYLGRV